MATLASLVVSLEANVARFESDLNKAEFMAKKAMDTITNVSETVVVPPCSSPSGCAPISWEARGIPPRTYVQSFLAGAFSVSQSRRVSY